ncbi:hypothetical protein AAG570_013824 [Ranatra chinensis]|uniref:Uncharacterized protein n=1 Tax=Ranatra chinensis TaxID=642074 RepID=A0ABD0YDB1_9HEMI
MGAKASTANGDEAAGQRTFGQETGTGLLRALPGVLSGQDRQRARSLSSVQDETAGGHPASGADAGFDISESVETDTSSNGEHLDSPLPANISLGRVYTAHSLPSRIFSWNGEYSIVII